MAKNTLTCLGFALLVSACGGKDNDDSNDGPLGTVTINGMELRACSNTKLFIEGPEDTEHFRGCQAIMSGLSIMTTVAEDLQDFNLGEVVYIEGHLHIADSPSLLTLKGLEKLEIVDSPLYVLYNDNLQNLEGLSSLREIPTMQVILNQALRDITLPELVSVSNTATIENNQSLESIHFLSLESIGALSVVANGPLHTLNLPNIVSMGSFVEAVNPDLILSDELESFK